MHTNEGQAESMHRRDHLTDEFERHRARLRAIAYRMLGSMTEAEDAVQEAWVRLDRSDPGGDADLRGWLSVVVGRICLDMLRTRRTRRETYAGSWLPEPLVDSTETRNPERETLLADSVGIAMLVVLEELSPAERLAFVLHDVFGVPFVDIANVVERSPEAARQLASRARRRVRTAAPAQDADVTVQRDVIDAFLAAARSGDFEGLLRLLDPAVVFRIDVGGVGRAARPPLVGASAVAGELVQAGRPFAPLARAATVNGLPGAIAGIAGRRPVGVVAFSVVGGRIATIDLISDPAKLRGLVVPAG